jgi:hypothetical protein
MTASIIVPCHRRVLGLAVGGPGVNRASRPLRVPGQTWESSSVPLPGLFTSHLGFLSKLTWDDRALASYETLASTAPGPQNKSMCV